MSYEFMSKLQQITYANINQRLKLQEDRRELYDVCLKETIDVLYAKIISNCIDKMLSISREGYFSMCLFEYTPYERFEDHNINFLFKGPRYTRNGDFFRRKGITPLMNKLVRYFNPITCFSKYNRKTNTSQIIVSWKNS